MWKYLAALLVVLLAMGGLVSATSVIDISSNMAEVSAGGSVNSGQIDTSHILANGDVIDLAQQGVDADAYRGFANIKMESTQGVSGAKNVALQTIQAADQDSKKGGLLSMKNTQATSNSGNTEEMAVNTAEQTGGERAVFIDGLSNSQSGYGAKDNEVTGINDLQSETGQCGAVFASLTNTKSIDPANVKAWDENDANIASGTIGLTEKNKDTIGATNSIDATEKNKATTFAYLSSDVKLTDEGTFFSPGNVESLSTNTAKSQAIRGDAKVSEKISVDVNTHPWGPSKPNQMIDIGSFNVADVDSIFADASNLQDIQSNVH